MPRAVKPQSADDAMRERQALMKHYAKTRREYRDALFATPEGERLHEFTVQLRRYGRTDAMNMVLYVREQAHGWLATAQPQIRCEALSLVNERIADIRVRSGLPPFDDRPFPGPDDAHDVWQQCKRELT
jgi:hypothetical protein